MAPFGEHLHGIYIFHVLCQYREAYSPTSSPIFCHQLSSHIFSNFLMTQPDNRLPPMNQCIVTYLVTFPSWQIIWFGTLHPNIISTHHWYVSTSGSDLSYDCRSKASCTSGWIFCRIFFFFVLSTASNLAAFWVTWWDGVKQLHYECVACKIQIVS